jgi:hypothetical protein
MLSFGRCRQSLFLPNKWRALLGIFTRLEYRNVAPAVESLEARGLLKVERTIEGTEYQLLRPLENAQAASAIGNVTEGRQAFDQARLAIELASSKKQMLMESLLPDLNELQSMLARIDLENSLCAKSESQTLLAGVDGAANLPTSKIQTSGQHSENAEDAEWAERLAFLKGAPSCTTDMKSETQSSAASMHVMHKDASVPIMHGCSKRWNPDLRVDVGDLNETTARDLLDGVVKAGKGRIKPRHLEEWKERIMDEPLLVKWCIERSLTAKSNPAGLMNHVYRQEIAAKRRK